MSIFWFVAGMLTMLAAMIVALPWLRTIPSFKMLPAVPWPVTAIGAVIVIAAVAMYYWFGTPNLTDARNFAALSTLTGTGRHDMTDGSGAAAAAAGSMQSAIDSLRNKLGNGAGIAQDWELLAQSYEFIGRPDAAQLARSHKLPPVDAQPEADPEAPPEAPLQLTAQSRKLMANALQAKRQKQYARAASLYQELAAAHQMNADSWADFADTVGTLQGGKLAGDPQRYVANALTLDANHPKALWLDASADEETGNLAAAITVWKRLLEVLPPGSSDAAIVDANLQRDQRIAADPAPADRAAGVSISGEISISGALGPLAATGVTLFVVAKSVDRPGPPVAVYRGSVSAWPIKFTLDDSSAMVPGRNLSSAGRVTIEARISRSGQALPVPGDFRGVTGIIELPARQPLKILIDEVVS